MSEDLELYWLADPGHSWLVVPAGAVRVAQAIHGVEITEHSLVSELRDLAYLEGDEDAWAFLFQGLASEHDQAAVSAAANSFPIREIEDFNDYVRRHSLVAYTWQPNR